jgi:hypothetical protein
MGSKSTRDCLLRTAAHILNSPVLLIYFHNTINVDGSCVLLFLSEMIVEDIIRG